MKAYGEDTPFQDVHSRLQQLVSRHAEERRPAKLLEAGCGSASTFNFGAETYMVGIDISAKQLERNDTVHEKIVGDIETYPLPAGEFDFVICWYVLEHLERPRLAMENLERALRPGGVLIFAVPNLLSIQGLVTRLTPLTFHKWTYRYFFGRKDAGENDTGPFPTYLKRAIAPPSIRRLAAEKGLSLVFEEVFEGNQQIHIRRRHRVLDTAFRTVGALGALTGDRFQPLKSSCVYALRKSDLASL